MTFPELEKEIRNEIETIINRYWSSRGLNDPAKAAGSQHNSERARRAKRRRNDEPIILVRQFPWRIGVAQGASMVSDRNTETRSTPELPERTSRNCCA